MKAHHAAYRHTAVSRTRFAHGDCSVTSRCLTHDPPCLPVGSGFRPCALQDSGRPLCAKGTCAPCFLVSSSTHGWAHPACAPRRLPQPRQLRRGPGGPAHRRGAGAACRGARVRGAPAARLEPGARQAPNLLLVRRQELGVPRLRHQPAAADHAYVGVDRRHGAAHLYDLPGAAPPSLERCTA